MKIIVLSDLHFDDKTHWRKITEEMLRRIRNIIRDNEKIIFVFLGDIINGYGGRTTVDARRFYIEADNFIEYIKREFKDGDFYFIPGNHDLDSNNLDLFNEFSGKHSSRKCEYTKENSVFLIEKYNINLILVDSNLSRDYGAHGQIDGELLKSKVSPKKSIIFIHHPPFHTESYSGDDDKSLKNPLDIMYLHAKIVFYGHQHGDHKVSFFYKEDTLYVPVSGLLNTGNEIKNDFIVLDIEDSELRSCYRYEYNGDKFFKKIILPQKQNKSSEELSIISFNSNTEKISGMISRYYYLSDNRIENLNLNEIVKENDYVIITGEAGIGKTIETRWLYIQYENNEEYFPILIDLRYVSVENAKKYIDYAKKYTIDNKNVFLIVDGVSELTSNIFGAIASELRTLSQEEKTIKIVISKRDNYNTTFLMETFRTYHLKEFNDSNVIEYAKLNGIIDADAFYKAVTSSNCIELAHIPFFLSELVNIYKEGYELSKFEELFNRILTIKFIESDKNLNNKYKIMPVEYKVRESFSELGFVMQALNKQLINNIFYSRMFGEELQCRQENTGLLYIDKEYNRGFIHDIFGEFFVANYLDELDLETLLNIITFDYFGKKKIRKLWYDIVRRIISLRDSDDLIQWIIENDKDFFLTNKPEKLNGSQALRVAQNVFKCCFDKNLPIHTVIMDVGKFVKEYESKEFWNYVTEELEKFHNEFCLSTLLQVLQYATIEYDKDKIKKILMNMLRNKEYPKYIVSFILKVMINIYDDADIYIDRIISILKDETDCNIIKNLFDIISQCSNPDKYYTFVISKFEEKDHGEIDISFNNSFIKVIYSFKTIDTILASIKYMCENDNYLYIYNSNVFFEKMISKITDSFFKYEDSREKIYEYLYDCFILLSQNVDGGKAKLLKNFFEKTGKQKEVLYRIVIDKVTMHYYSCLENIMDSSLIEDFVEYYYGGLLCEDKFIWYANRYSISSENQKKLNSAYQQMTGNSIKITEKSSWMLNQEKKESEYFESLFNKEVFNSKIIELIELLGEDILIDDFIEKSIDRIPKDRQDLQNVGDAVLQYNNVNMMLSQFVEKIDWDDFCLTMIFEFLRLKNNVNLSEKQKVFLKNYFDKIILVDLKNLDYTLNSNIEIVERIVILIEKVGFICEDNKLLDMLMLPWYIFASSTSSGVSETLTFVSKHISNESLIEKRILYNLKNKELNIFAAETHIIYCLRNNLHDALDIAVDLFKSTEKDAYNRKYSAVQYLLKFKGEEFVDDLITVDTEEEVMEYLSGYLHQSNNNLIKEMLRKNHEADDELYFVRELIGLNSKEGIKKYVDYVRKYKKIPEVNSDRYISSDITMQIRKINDISLLDEVKALLYIAYSNDFIDKNNSFGLKENLNNALNNLGYSHPNDMIPLLESIITSHPKNDQLQFVCNYHLQRIYENLKVTNEKSWTFNRALNFVKRMRELSS